MSNWRSELEHGLEIDTTKICMVRFARPCDPHALVPPQGPRVGQLIAFTLAGHPIAIPDGEQESFLFAWRQSP